MAFPDDPLDIRLDFAFGADVDADPSTWDWTSMSEAGAETWLYDRLMDAPIIRRRGRTDQAQAVAPTTLRFVLDNADRALLPDNPLSPFYPHVGIGTPVRLRTEGEGYAENYGNQDDRISTPDHASFAITNLHAGVEVEVLDWPTATEELFGQQNLTGNQRGWLLAINADRKPVLVWSTDGTALGETVWTSTVALPAAPGRYAIWVTLDFAGGASFTATWYYAESLDDTPILLDSIGLGGASSIHNSTANLALGDVTYGGGYNTFNGRILRAVLYDDIDGTPVASPDFRSAVDGDTSVVDAQGHTWTVGGTTILSNLHTRFIGQVSDIVPDFPHGDPVAPADEASTDPTVERVEASIEFTASGITRRMGQGQSDLVSPMRSAWLQPQTVGDAPPVAYWPMEDGSEADRAASAIPGRGAIKMSAFDFGSDDTLLGSDNLPSLSSGTRGIIAAPLPAMTAGEWYLTWMVRLPQNPAGTVQLGQVVSTSTLNLVGGGSLTWTFSVSATQFFVSVFNGTGTLAFTTASATAFYTGRNRWVQIVLWVKQNGGNVDIQALYWPVGVGAGTGAATSLAGNAGRPLRYNLDTTPSTGGLSIGHLMLRDNPPDGWWGDHPVFLGHDGELAADRLERLATEHGLPMRIIGDPADTEAMGPQGIGTLLGLLNECAAADMGLLYEDPLRPGLVYRTRSDIYNQDAWALDAHADHITLPFTPRTDDAGVKNVVTVSRSGGSSATVEDEESIAAVGGRFEDSRTVNVQTDDVLDELAGWVLSLGVSGQRRYRSVVVDLAMDPSQIPTWLEHDIAHRFTLANLPSEVGTQPVERITEGFTETMSPYDWTVSLDSTDGEPWQVVVVGETSARIDANNSVLGAAIDTDDTLLDVSDGDLWINDTDHAAQFPFDVMVGGERMTVTASTGSVLTVTRSVNGVVKSHAIGTEVRVADPVRLAL